jgi:hypothetical protein
MCPSLPTGGRENEGEGRGSKASDKRRARRKSALDSLLNLIRLGLPEMLKDFAAKPPLVDRAET